MLQKKCHFIAKELGEEIFRLDVNSDLSCYSLCRGKKYGETANECGEAFFFYGKSLLELARYVFQAKSLRNMFCIIVVLFKNLLLCLLRLFTSFEISHELSGTGFTGGV